MSKKLLLVFVSLFLALSVVGCTVDEAAFVNTDTPLNVTESDPVDSVSITGASIIDSGLKVTDEPFFSQVGQGNVPGHSQVSRFGYNGAVGTTSEDIWLGSAVFVFPTIAQQMELISNSAQDGPGGTGVRTVTIFYLDANYNEQTEVVTTNGTTAVLTTATNIFRVNEMMSDTVGSSGGAVGQLSLSSIGGTPIYRYIFPAFNRSRGSQFTVPAGKTLYVNHWMLSVGGLNAGNFARMIFRSTYNDVSGEQLTAGTFFVPQAEVLAPNGAYDRHFDFPMVFPATTDLKVSAFVDAGSAFVETTWRGWLE